jgi:hypothetical protein
MNNKDKYNEIINSEKINKNYDNENYKIKLENFINKLLNVKIEQFNQSTSIASSYIIYFLIFLTILIFIIIKFIKKNLKQIVFN